MALRIGKYFQEKLRRIDRTQTQKIEVNEKESQI